MAENIFKEPKSGRESGAKGESRKPGILSSLLNGSFLAKDKSAELLPFVFFLAMLAVMLIANTYYAEKKVREIERMRSEVTELRTLYISNKSQLMHLSNQSEIARRLHAHGFEESTVPPRLVTNEKNRRSFLLRIVSQN
jgi:hypothetical protein